MPNRPLARLHTLLTTIVALAVLVLAGPAFAQTDTASDTPATDQGQSSQPMQSTTPDSAASDSDSTDGGAAPNQGNNAPAQPAQQLPKPKSSDYGASTYNAPSDAELAQFTAMHPTPTADDSDTGDNSTDSVQSGDDGASDEDASSSSDTTGATSDADDSAPNNRDTN